MRVHCKNRNCDIADSEHVVAGNFAISSQESCALILELSATTFAAPRVVNQQMKRRLLCRVLATYSRRAQGVDICMQDANATPLPGLRLRKFLQHSGVHGTCDTPTCGSGLFEPIRNWVSQNVNLVSSPRCHIRIGQLSAFILPIDDLLSSMQSNNSYNFRLLIQFGNQQRTFSSARPVRHHTASHQAW